MRLRVPHLKSLGTLALTIGFLVFVFRSYTPESVGNALQSIPLSVLATAFVLLALNQLLGCLRFHWLLQDFGVRQPLRTSIQVNIFSLVGGVVLFNYFGQSLTRSALLKQGDDSPAMAFILTAVERAVALGLLLLMAAAGAVVLFGGLNVGEEGSSLIVLVVGLVTVAVAVLGIAFRRHQHNVLHAVMIAGLLRPTLRAAAVTAVMHATMLAAYAALAVPLAGGASLATLVAVSSVVMLAASLPISFAGWGIREFSAAYAFGAIGLVPEAGLAVAIAVGLLSLAALGANTAAVLALRRYMAGAGARAAGTSDERVPFVRLLAWMAPPAAAALVLFQVPVPTASGIVNINLADPIAIVGALTLALIAAEGGRWRNLWRVKGGNLALAVATLALGLGFVNGLAHYGLIEWALYNRFLGWLILLAFLLTGALATSVVGQTGVTTVSRTYVAACAAIVLAELLLRLFDDIANTRLTVGPFFPRFVGMVGNPNAFGFQLVLALALALPAANLWLGRRARLWEFITLGLLFLGLWSTGSRSLILTGAGVLLLFLALRLAPWRRILGGVAAALAIMVTAEGLLYGYDLCFRLAEWLGADTQQVGQTLLGRRFIGSASYAVLRSDLVDVQSDRLSSLIGGWEMWLHHPVFGAGLGAFIQSQIEQSGVPLVIHNSALWLGAELGIVGLLAVALLPAIVLRELWRDPRWRHHSTGAAAFGCLAAMGVASMAHDLFYQRPFWLLMGVLLATPRCLAQRRFPAAAAEPVQVPLEVAAQHRRQENAARNTAA